MPGMSYIFGRPLQMGIVACLKFAPAESRRARGHGNHAASRGTSAAPSEIGAPLMSTFEHSSATTRGTS